MKRAAYSLLLVAVLTAGCASTGTPGGAEDRNRITAPQLAKVQADNAYEAVRVLQPQWLDTRGPRSATDSTPLTAVVYLDGSRVGDLEFLRTLSLTVISEIRYLPTAQASARYGMGLGGGVIEVITRR